MKHETPSVEYESDSDLDIEDGELSRHDEMNQSPDASSSYAALRAVSTADLALEHQQPSSSPSQQPKATSSGPVGWKDLPRKGQLVVITLARMSEPLVQTSLQSYMFYQLKWFDPSLPDSTISSQAGVLHASFMAAQFVTAMLWGRIADSDAMGRKRVLLIGLLGTSLSCLGFGFSTSFRQALLFRTLGGATNGNIGVMRTM